VCATYFTTTTSCQRHSPFPWRELSKHCVWGVCVCSLCTHCLVPVCHFRPWMSFISFFISRTPRKPGDVLIASFTPSAWVMDLINFFCCWSESWLSYVQTAPPTICIIELARSRKTTWYIYIYIYYIPHVVSVSLTLSVVKEPLLTAAAHQLVLAFLFCLRDTQTTRTDDYECAVSEASQATHERITLRPRADDFDLSRSVDTSGVFTDGRRPELWAESFMFKTLSAIVHRCGWITVALKLQPCNLWF